MTNFTQEELELAKQADLVWVASSLGFHPKKIGRFHTLKEMDSIRIYDRTNWYRFSNGTGGSQIDFLVEFAGLSVKEAIFWLLDFIGYARSEETVKKMVVKNTATNLDSTKRKEFELPKASTNNTYLYSYLTKERKISKEIVDYMIEKELIYESEVYHNVVFLGKDKSGKVRFASQRGVFDRNGKSFKGDVTGSDKNYGFNLPNETSNEVIVFEAAIDLLSYMEIYDDYKTNKLALGMLNDRPLATFLDEHPNVESIILCLDNDERGSLATEALKDKYLSKGYRVTDKPAPSYCKDYNEWLVEKKKINRQIRR